MSDSNVEKALSAAAVEFLTVVTELNTSKGLFDGLPVVESEAVAWENRNFDIPSNGTWCSYFYVPNTPTGRTVGKGGIDEITGFIQIDFNTPLNSGNGELKKWEDKARLYFPGGRSFTFDGQNVLVISSGLSQGRTVDNHFRKSLTVSFTAQLKRTILT